MDNDLNIIKKELASASYRIDGMISRRFISKNDIIDIFSKPSYEVLAYNREMLKDQKLKMLYVLYLKPFELYYSKYLDDDLLEVLLDFAKRRYLEEKTYLDDQMNEGLLNRNFYKSEIEKLQMYYLYSSIYGLSILRSVDSDEQKKIHK